MRRNVLKAAFAPPLWALWITLWPTLASAQSLNDGDVLPKNVGGVIISPGTSYGNGLLQRYAAGWQTFRESVLTDVNDVPLANQFGDPAAVRFGLNGDLGTTSFDGSASSFALNLTGAYGITDRLTVAVVAPFQWVRYSLDAALVYKDGDPSDFHVTGNLQCPAGNFNLNLDSITALGTFEDGYRFNIGDLERVLTSECFGYDPVFDRFERGDDGLLHGRTNRTKSGFRDIAFGAKYQFFHGRHVRLAGLFYVVAGTGKPASPNKLIDFKLGDGNWNVGFVLGSTFPLGNFRLGLGAGYDIELPDSERLRLYGLGFSQAQEDRLARGEITEQELFAEVDQGNIQPLVTRYDVVEVQRKLGNNINVYGVLSYQVFEWLSVGVTFTLLHHFRDRINSIGDRPDGAAPYPTEQEVRAEVQAMVDRGEIAEDDRIQALKDRLPGTDGRKKAAYSWRTVRGQLGMGFGLNFNTLAMFARDEFPIPLIASIGMNYFVAGQNIDTPDSLALNLTLPFALGEVKDPASWGYDEDGEGPPWM